MPRLAESELGLGLRTLFWLLRSVKHNYYVIGVDQTKTKGSSVCLDWTERTEPSGPTYEPWHRQ